MFRAVETTIVDSISIRQTSYSGHVLLPDTTVHGTTIVLRYVSAALRDASRGIYQEVAIPRTNQVIRVLSWFRYLTRRLTK